MAEINDRGKTQEQQNEELGLRWHSERQRWDERKTKEELIEELQRLRQRVADLQESENQREQAQEALRESERQYRQIVEEATDVVYTTDPQGCFTYVNPPAQELIGCSANELIGKHFTELIPADWHERVQSFYQKQFRERERETKMELPVITRAGEEKWVEQTVTLLTEGDWVTGFQSIVRDITGQRRAETERERLLTALERRTTQLQTAAEVSRAVSSILDPDALTPQVVDLVRERFGLYYVGLFLVDRTGEWTGEPGKWAVLRAGTGEAGRQMLRQGHKLEIGSTSMIGWCVANKQARVALDLGEEAVRFENPLLPETRSELALPLVSRGRAIGALTIQSSQEAAFSKGDITVLQTMADQLANAIANAHLYDQAQREITERKRAEEALRESEEKYRTILESIEDGYYEVDLAGNLTFFNNSLCRLYRYPKDELMGMNYRQYMDDETAKTVYQAFNAVYRTEEPARAFNWGVIRKDGTRGSIEVSVSPISGPTGEPAGFRGTVRDVTERKQAEEELQRRAAQAALVYEVGQRVSGELGREALLSETVTAVRDAFDYYGVMMLLLDKEPERLTLQAIAGGYVGTFPEDLWLAVGEGMIGHAAATGETQISSDVSKEPHYVRKADEKTKSELAVPIKSGQRLIGVLDLQSDEFDAFDEADVMVMETLADQIAVAIENARLYEAVQQELTERKRAEEALQETHEELERYTDRLERRTAQLQVGAEVAREAAAILDIHQLLDTAVHLISERFGFYHAGAFLMDARGEYAVLRAASSDGGQRMLERGHRLLVGKVGIVGYVAATGEPRIALDVGKDATFFDNPDLPGTRSEMGLPLNIRGRTIGVLDVQAIQEAAFSEDDVAVLQTLADQLAVAIDYARLVERTETQLRELSLLYGEHSAATWTELASRERPLGYVYDRIGVVPTERLSTPVLDMALTRGETVAIVEPETTERVLATPLKLHNQVIGTLGIQETDGGRTWSSNEIALVEAVSEQVAQALENAQHFADTQRSAQQMQVLNELAQALATSLTVEAVLEETYQGASRLLDTTNFYIGLYDSEKDEIKFAFDVSESGQDKEYTTIPADQGLAGYIVRNRTSVLIRENESERLREMGIEPVGQPSLSWLGVPLLIGNQSLGAIAVQSYTTLRAYDERDRDVLAAIASQTAIALQNARLFEEVQRRATHLAAAAEVARDATAILDIDQLLDETVHLISEQFDFYHAGVFLLDEQDEYAVLQAASSEGGQRMLNRNHKLPVGKVGIVGNVAATGEPHIALDVGKDAVHFVNPDLLGTRSEMGLPLKVRERVIGVLDVQSTHESAFSEEDIAVLQTLADQLAAAIANARLFQEVRADATRRALINEVQQAAAASLNPDELLHRAGEVISRRLERRSAILSWEPEDENLRPVAVHDENGDDVPLADELRVTRKMNPTLFSEVVDGSRIYVLDAGAQHPGNPAATLGEQLGIQNGVYVPLTTRDQVLGVLALAQPEGRSSEGTDFVKITGANLSVALENARLYQEAVETTEKLQEMDRLKSQFLANMSHELRTPLNSIIGFSRVILKGIDGPLTDMQRTDLEAVHNSGQHLLGLINDILDISKIQAGKMELSFEDTDLAEVIKGVMSTAIALVKDKPIELQQSVPSDVPTIRADPRRIRQVLLNIVGNSAKFTEEGFIRVEVEAGPSDVVMSVVDSGVGIPPEKLDNIFEEFTQVDGSSTRSAGGTGLGLSISARFVEMHGGRIWVESAPDAGSAFHITLPIEGPPEPSEEETEAEQPEPEPRPGPKNILCVDDDEGVITLFRRYLSKQGYRVVGLTDSAAVVEKARQLKPFAITLDVMMPNKDGWQVIQELKADPDVRHIPVIMCTIVGEKEHGLSLGASDYLLKPILEDDLVAALERLEQEEGHHRVLVVDDQSEDRRFLRRMIESRKVPAGGHQYEVVEAAGGQEAITLIRTVRPDIIILDLMMPEIDGFAVLESIKADKTTRSIPIIIVTAKDLTQEERDILNKGVEALLQKGIFEQEELLADVAAALEQVRTDQK